MIRLFTALGKAMLDSLTDEHIFRDATEAFQHYGERCPHCGASGKLSPYGGYYRCLVSRDDDNIVARRIRPLRFKCASCGTTHALLPDILIPYSPYSLRFKLSVLIDYFQRHSTVAAICERFEIAVSTLYEWKKLLLSHKELFLGVLVSYKEPVLDFLRGLFVTDCLSERLCSFFHRCAFSFLQAPSALVTRSLPP